MIVEWFGGKEIDDAMVDLMNDWVGSHDSLEIDKTKERQRDYCFGVYGDRQVWVKHKWGGLS